jgi:hypothetical protein
MKNILLLLTILLLKTISKAQLPYSWVPGVNPGWFSANSGSGNALNWNNSCLGGVVTTNCTGNYANNQNTTYTSPIINATCSNASTISISFNISGNAEYGYDFLFCEYSTDGGVTWINFYGPGVGLTGNAGTFPGTLWILPVISTSNNFKFRFRFTSDPAFKLEGYKLTNFSISCNDLLPIELVSFKGYRYELYNLLTWETNLENNNFYFVLERSNDGYFWETIAIKKSTDNLGTNTYYHKDYSYKKGNYNYYRLTQIDFNNEFKYYNLIYIDNNICKEPELIKTLNMLGQEVDQFYKGFVVEFYNNGIVKKVAR